MSKKVVWLIVSCLIVVMLVVAGHRTFAYSLKKDDKEICESSRTKKGIHKTS